MASNSTVKRPSPAKKFGLFGKIKNEIRSALRKENVWVHNTPSGLLKRFNADVANKVLPVKGTNYKDLDYNLVDVISLFDHINVQLHQTHHGRRLKDSPMFSEIANLINIEKETQVDEYELFTKKGNHNLFAEMFQVKHSRYEARQNHKITGAFKYDKWSTFVLCLDMALDYIQFHSIYRIPEYMRETLLSPEYSRIDVDGLYAFILHLYIRGVARPSSYLSVSKWRDAWVLRNPNERQHILTMFYSGINSSQVQALQQSYIQEKLHKTSILRHETKLIRSTYVPDKTLFNPEFVFYATWYYGIFEKMTPTERYRDSLNLPLYPKQTLVWDEKPCSCKNLSRTMWHDIMLGKVELSCPKHAEDFYRKNFGKELKVGTFTGLVDSVTDNAIDKAKVAVQEVIDKSLPKFEERLNSFSEENIEKAKSVLNESVQKTLSDPATVQMIRESTHEALKPVIEDINQRVTTLTDKTVDDLKATVAPVLNESMGTFTSLNGILGFLKETMKSITNMVPVDLLGRIGIKIDLEILINIFKYYIIYINVDSPFIKTALFILMLRELGIFELLQQYGTTVLTWMRNSNLSPEIDIPADAVVAEPTGVLDWMNTLMNMINGHVSEITICTFISLLLTVVYKVSTSPARTPLKSSDHKTVSGFVLEAFKNIHFIGAGCYGFERIIKYAKVVGDVVSKWVSYYIFGKSADERKVEKQIARWYGQLSFFMTEGGRSAIRVNEKTLQLAEKIQPDGLAFIQMHAADPNCITRDAIQLVQRSQKNAADLASFCYRIRAMSNFQPAMFHVQFVGPPGIGKSTLTETLISKIAAEIYPKDKKITHYSYNPNLDYFDGYNQQTFMIIDDLFRFNEPKHLSLLIGLITNTPVMLPMAHLDEKGMQLQTDFLISSTNTPYPEGKDIFCMEAVHRRRHVLIEVEVDESVMDKANSQFSRSLFDKHYPGQNPRDFPHLKFNLLKPTIRPNETKIKGTTGDEMRYYEKTLERIREVNQTLSFDPSEYFGEDAAPAAGFTVPCKGWNLDLLIKNIVARYSALRSSEMKMSAKDKYTHVMDCFDEIDAIQNQQDDLNSIEFDKKHTLIANRYLDASYAYGCEDPLGQKIYLSEEKVTDLMPELDKLDDLEKIVDDILAEEAVPTSDTRSSVYEDASSDLTAPRIQCVQDYIAEAHPPQEEVYRCQALITTLTGRANLNHLSPQEYKLYDKIMSWHFQKTNPYIPFNTGELDSDEEEEIVQSQRRIVRYNRVHKHDELRYSSIIKEVRDRKTGTHLQLLEISDAYECLEEEFMNKMEKEVGLPLINPKSAMHEFTIETKLKTLEESQFIDAPKAQRIRDFLRHGKEQRNTFYYPKRTPYTKSQRGMKTAIPREWMKRFYKDEGIWYMNITDLHFSAELPHSSKEERPMDIGFLLLSDLTFTLAIAEFARMTTAQQDDAVKTVRWMYRHLAYLSLDNIKEQVSTIFGHIKQTLLTYVFSPLQHFWNAVTKFDTMCIGRIVNSALFFIIGIATIRQIGSLLTGKSQPTSKFMHRAPKPGITYKGKFTQGILSFANNTDAQLAQTYLDRNVRFIKITNQEGITQVAHAIHTNQYLIINKHVADKIDDIVEVEFCPTVKHPNIWTFQIKPSNIYCLPNSDVAIIYSRLMPMARDIRQHFITDKDYQKLDSIGELWSLSRFQDEAAVEIRTSCRPYQDASMITEDGSETGFISRGILVEGETICGKSGSMLIRPNKSPGNRNILGIQAWKYKEYYRRTIIYQVVTQENLELMIQKVHEQTKLPQIIQTGPLVAEPTSSNAEELIESHIEVIGSVPADKRVGMVGKTAFRRTKIAHLMDQDGYQSKRVPAALNPFDPRLNVPMHPMQHSINKYGRGIVGPFDLRMMEKATHDIAYWLRNQLDKTTFDYNLPLEVCVTGTRELGSNPIDCKASPGLPYVWEKFPGKLPGKKNIVQISEEGECVIVDPNYPAQFEKFFEKLTQGIIPPHSSYDFPKDELRPIEKALGNSETMSPPKTRSVTCMSLDVILSWRRLTLDLFAALHRRARGDFPFGPGINPDGPDWARLYHHLNKHSHVLDFDVSNWDGHMPIDLMMSVGDILCIVLGIKQTSPQAKAIYSILTEVVFGHVQFEDMVYHKLRGLISGFPGTAETNTLAHILLIYYFYLLICQENEQYHYMNITAFNKNCSLICYGDDIQMSISPELISFFHGKSIAEQYELHGYPVTDAAKGKDIPYYKQIHESQFLKSSFNVISPSRVDRKLDLDVVYDLFYWVRAKEHPFEQFCSNINDAMRIVHGHGKEVYDQVLNQLNLWLTKMNIPTFDIRWENFEEMHIKNYYSD